MTFSTSELVHICRTDMLMSGGRDSRNRLASAITAEAEGLTLSYGANRIGADDQLSIGFEDLAIWQVSGSNVTVERGADGTTPAAHAAGATVLVNTPFSPGQVLRSMKAELVTLGSTPGLGRVAHTTFEATIGNYTSPALGVDPDKIVSVSGQSLSDADEWTDISSFSVQRTSAGTSLILYDGWQGTVRVSYWTSYGEITADTADVAATTGLGDPTLLAVGAALRLTRGRPIRRSMIDAQGDSRRAQEVTGFDTTQADLNLERWYRQLITTEKARLIARYPARRRTVR